MGQDRAVECHGKQSTNDTGINEGVIVSKINGNVSYWKEHFTSATPSSLKSVLPLAFLLKNGTEEKLYIILSSDCVPNSVGSL